MRMHTTSEKHWVILDGNTPCPTCGADKLHPCISSKRPMTRFPMNTVHVSRVKAAGHNVYRSDVMPVHRAQVVRKVA